MSKRFCKDGVEAAGVARLMAGAGLTHGGFYTHFGSKEAPVKEALTDALDNTWEGLEWVACAEGGGIEALVRMYLAPQYRPGQGCATASLVPEIARHSRPTRVAFMERIEVLVNLIAEHLQAGDQHTRRKAAMGILP